jgi:hypothetical protein
VCQARPNHPVWSPPSAILRALVPQVWFNRPARRCRPRRRKRKAEELSGSDGSSEPAIRRPAPNQLEGSSAPDTYGEAAASCKPLPGKDGPAYAAIVAGYAKPQQSSGPSKPSAKVSDTSEPAVSSEAALRRMSTEMSRPLDGTPASTNLTAKVVPAGE